MSKIDLFKDIIHDSNKCLLYVRKHCYDTTIITYYNIPTREIHTIHIFKNNTHTITTSTFQLSMFCFRRNKISDAQILARPNETTFIVKKEDGALYHCNYNNNFSL